MADQQITNPTGAHKTVTDFRLFKSADGEDVSLPSAQAEPFRANAAILRGEVLMWVVPTASVPLSVTPMTAAAADNLFAGIALEAAAAGEQVFVCTKGGCFVDVGAETPAFGNPITSPATTTGKAEIGATFDATLVVGSFIGTALGAKDANNLTPAVISFA